MTATLNPIPEPSAARAPISGMNIDLVGPAGAMSLLGIGENQLLDLVNSGTLAAYRLSGAIRFRRREVQTLIP